ncbi:MAG: copper amine oxidase N-terminal domain-containing protein, partial [Selenomonadales bacterium]|nr:copper amine oxidase N-terminal domain-containing protein [Selenomonadales bacterium]
MIKRVAIVSTIALLLLSGLGGITLTAAQQPAIRVMFNGQYMNLDVPPVIQGGRTLVPFRAIFEALGATVSWNDATRTATGPRGTTT